MVRTLSASEKTPAATILAYILPCLPIAAMGLPIVVYLPNFYANTVGLALPVVGFAFMMARTLDIVIDPLLGGLMDRTQVKMGRFRLWMLIGLPITFTGAALLFFPPKSAGAAYLIAALIVSYVGYSINVLAQGAWGATLSKSYHDRSRLYGWWQAANIAGLLLVLLLPVALGLKGSADAVRVMGMWLLVSLPVTIGLMTLFTPEPTKSATSAHRSVFETVRAVSYLLRHGAVARILAADLLLGLAPGVTGALFLFFFRAARHYSSLESNALLLFYFVGGILGAPLWVRLSRRIGKHRALIASCGFYVVVQSTTMLMPKMPMLAAALALVVAGLSYAASLFLLRALMADAVDEVRLETGRDDTALMFALLGSTNKLGYAIAVGLTFVGLDRVGFHPGDAAANSAAALNGLTMLYIILPALAATLGALVLFRYPLTEARHDDIRKALDSAGIDHAE